MLKDLEPRDYQLELFFSASKQNSLIVLPTGLGKTAISMLLAARRFLQNPNKKIIFLAPTKPLVEQQLNSFKKHFILQETDFVLLTGTVQPKKRKDLFEKSRFIFSTPQTIENDILAQNISLKEVSLIVFDEAHRASGNYAYVYVAQNYMQNSENPLILALTASPGTDKESIDQICKNLFVEKIEFKSRENKEVSKYVEEVKLKWEEIELTDEIKKIIFHLNNSCNNKLKQIKSFGFLNNINNTNKITLLNLQKNLHGEIAKGNKSLEILKTISLLAESIKLQHALELIETQSLFSLLNYMEGIVSKSKVTKTKSVQNLVSDIDFLSALALTRDAISKSKVHPKITWLQNQIKNLINEKKDTKTIIFTQFRDTATELQKQIDHICLSKVFFGQAKKNGVGFTQKEQKQTIDDFSQNKFQVLIATSVAEEGLDIPSVDRVFFYEPIPSAIRSVQRRGRTGRHSKGHVTILVSKGTRDEAYKWAAYNKEKNMFKTLNAMSQPNVQKSLEQFTQKEDVFIYVDFREKGSSLVKELLKQNISIKMKQLEVGDFLLSNQVVIEFKNIRDFVDSIVDGRLLQQLPSLLQYDKPVLIIEGDEDIYSVRNVSPEAIDGMLATIATSYRIPLFRTKNAIESARVLIAIAKREQKDKETIFTFHTSKPLDKSLLQEYIASSLPNVGGALAKKILLHFDNLNSFFKATKQELIAIEGLGDKKANDILEILSTSYKENTKDKY